ncbi:MAG: hypothetical protein ACYTGH_06920, partial [Planctomycetota bacterium]
MGRPVCAGIRWGAALLPVVASFLAVSLGLSWGLPDEHRAAFVFRGTDREALVDSVMTLVQSDRAMDTSMVTADVGRELGAGVISGQERLRVIRRMLLYTEHPDEMLTLGAFAGVNPRTFDFRPRNFQYGGGYLYPVAVFVAAGNLLAGNGLKPSLRSMLLAPVKMGRMYYAGRLLNMVAWCVLLAGLVWLFRLSSFSWCRSVFGAGVVGSFPALTNAAMILKPHYWAASFSILGIAVCMDWYLRRSGLRRLYLGVILLAVAAASQYTMV